jgi:hypothetical protein
MELSVKQDAEGSEENPINSFYKDVVPEICR